MPIRVPDKLPARETLVGEGVMVMDETAAIRQDIRPLQIGLLNLMPNKIRTETQIARLVGATPLQVELTLDDDFIVLLETDGDYETQVIGADGVVDAISEASIEGITLSEAEILFDVDLNGDTLIG